MEDWQELMADLGDLCDMLGWQGEARGMNPDGTLSYFGINPGNPPSPRRSEASSSTDAATTIQGPRRAQRLNR